MNEEELFSLACKMAEDYIKSDADFAVEGLSPYQNGKFNGFVDGIIEGYKLANNKTN